MDENVYLMRRFAHTRSYEYGNLFLTATVKWPFHAQKRKWDGTERRPATGKQRKVQSTTPIIGVYTILH